MILALLALLEGRPQVCLLWLGLALLVAGLDGTLARKFDVKVVLPHFAGANLDLVWMSACAWLIVQSPLNQTWLLAVWGLVSAYFVAICLWRPAREWFA